MHNMFLFVLWFCYLLRLVAFKRMCLCIVLWFQLCQFHVCECVCDTNWTMYIKTNGIKRPLPFINHKGTFTTLWEPTTPTYIITYIYLAYDTMTVALKWTKETTTLQVPNHLLPTFIIHNKTTHHNLQHPPPSHVCLPHSKLNLGNNAVVCLPKHPHQPPHLSHISWLNPPKFVHIGPCSSRAP